jgi:hypothetical protein
MNRMLFAIFIIILGGVVLYNLNPTQYWFMPKCPFKLITGLSCPGCGIQRAIHALMHGEIKEAIQYNYYLLYSGPYAASFLLVWLLPENVLRDKVKSIIENKYVVNFYLFTFLLWLVIRNIFSL